MIDAITDHLVRGSSEQVACAANGVKQQNFNKALNNLNVFAGKVEAIKNHDWHHLSNVILKEDEDNERVKTEN
jgi:hypothetical protein